MIIESYAVVFKHERRLRRVPYTDWDVPWPDGIPLRGIAYYAACILLMVVVSVFPPVTAVIGNPIARMIFVPVALAYLLHHMNPDGRPAHSYLWHHACMRWRHRPGPFGRSLTDGRVRVAWDASATDLQHVLLRGPQTVTFNTPVRYGLAAWRKRWIVRPHEQGTCETREIPVGETWEVRP